MRQGDVTERPFNGQLGFIVLADFCFWAQTGRNRFPHECPAREERTSRFDPTGKSLRFSNCGVSSPLCKNISVFPNYKSGYMIRHPVPKEGRCATSSTWDGDAVDADSAPDEGA
jgi:hypothetical protein